MAVAESFSTAIADNPGVLAANGLITGSQSEACNYLLKWVSDALRGSVIIDGVNYVDDVDVALASTILSVTSVVPEF